MTGDLAKVAQRQHGLFTHAQALECGVSRRVIQGRVARGDWVHVRRGVYAVAAVPPSYDQSVLAAVLAADAGGAWASHRTAAKLWEVKVAPPEAIDVLTLPGHRVRHPGVVHHRSAEIRLPDLSRVRGIPTTSIARTLVDCLPWLGEVGFSKALDDGQRRKLITADQVDDALSHLDRGHRTGRHLVAPGREPLALRAAGRLAGGSELELDILGILAAAGLPAPVQQYKIVIGRRDRFLDYAYPDTKIGIEFDGFADHGLIREVFDDDRIRDAELQLLGWLMLHPTSRTPPSELVRWVRTGLEARSA